MSTSPLADAIARHASRTVRQMGASWVLATVTATHTNGTVDITTATGPVTGVRRLRSYSSPVVGDVVQVDRNSDGNWLVTGALAP